ncbi:putative enterotoxin [Ophiocordyceps camponoti-floridani]|uniref:Putative enterotoxin n=1 Tax=Ophiocordyceps camponoti-floridani TaxID=2030778 RepID=A0A8H4VET9_9HYPO|nr:putative enterotoxin [Ophiocordyceps camponoti-floridani]
MAPHRALLLACVATLHVTLSAQAVPENLWKESLMSNSEYVVYRPDKISPHELRAKGGFWPSGPDPGRHVFMPPVNLSLYRHDQDALDPDRRDDWGFISFMSRYPLALNWLQIRSQLPGYIYAVHATPNFVSVDESLRWFAKSRDAQDYAAVGHVGFDQVMAWRRITYDQYSPGNLLIGAVEENSFYNKSRYENEAWSGAEYQLAVFPPQHEVVRDRLQPWCDEENCQPRSATVAAKAAALRLLASKIAVRSLKLHFRLSQDTLAGTFDSILVRIGESLPITIFKSPDSGWERHLDVDMKYAFGPEPIFLANLTGLRILHRRRRGRIWPDDFKVDGIRLEALTSLSDVPIEVNKFNSMERWVGTREVGVKVVWRKQISAEDWKWE